MRTVGFVDICDFAPIAISPSDAGTLRFRKEVKAFAGLERVLLYGIQHQVRVLQSNRPEVTPWCGLTYSTALNEINFWNGTDNLQVPGVFFAASYDTIPAKDIIMFPEPLVFSAHEVIHQTMTIENLDPINQFTKTMRWQTVLYFDYERKVREEARELWKEILRG